MALIGHYYKPENVEDYTAAANLNAGQVVTQGDQVGIVQTDLANGSLGAINKKDFYTFLKVHTAITAGDPVYIDDDGTPYDGTVGGGAATPTVGDGDNLLGRALATAGTNTATVIVDLNNTGAGDADADSLDSSAGTASGTIGTVAGTASGDTDDVINNNFSELATEVNAIKANLRAHGLVKLA